MRSKVWVAGAAALALMTPSPGRSATEGNFSVATTGDLIAVCSAQQGSPLATEAVNFC